MKPILITTIREKSCRGQVIGYMEEPTTVILLTSNNIKLHWNDLTLYISTSPNPYQHRFFLQKMVINTKLVNV